MNQVLLVLRCDMGTYLAVPVSMDEGHKFISDWQNDRLPKKYGGSGWAIDTGTIRLCHLESLEKQAQQSQQYPNYGQGGISWKGSGLN